MVRTLNALIQSATAATNSSLGMALGYQNNDFGTAGEWRVLSRR
jgi:hypothetical protein